MRTLTARIRKLAAAYRRSHPAGCCGCGAKTVRYVYAGPWRGQIVPDDARCEACGPVPGHPVTVDYGADVAVTVGEMDDAVTAATIDHSVARLATTAGLTVGQLRHLIHHLPADTPVRVEDPSRPGPVPGSTAEHTITGAATGMPLHAGGDGVLLLIDPKPEDDGAQPTAEEFRAAMLDHLQRAELQSLGLGPYDGAVRDLFHDFVADFEIPEGH